MIYLVMFLLFIIIMIVIVYNKPKEPPGTNNTKVYDGRTANEVQGHTKDYNPGNSFPW